MSIELTANKMIFLMFYILVGFSGIFSFHQHDYNLILERANIVFYNKSYFNVLKLEMYYLTRYTKRYNVTGDFIHDVDAHLLTFHLEARKFQSNEYRLFPFNYSENICSAFHDTKFGKIYDQFDTNFVPECLVKKGHYYVNNIHYDDSKFPPYAPRGRYLLISKLLYKETSLLYTGEIYIEIKPQNPLERIVGV